jgi:2-polyprenyl-6-hydroxyphenyl methylase / 3-demethylubiquinone-9 3-methyltransferase
MTAQSNIDPAEIARFAAQAPEWWDPKGATQPLQRINPARLQFIRDHLAAQFGRDARSLKPFAGLTLLDIGSGAGLVTEPMARLGFAVTGIDAGDAIIEAARAHAEGAALVIDYRAEPVEIVAARGNQFNAVLALEVIEHVPDPDAFLRAAASLVAPGGALILSTLNRTARAFVLGIIAAERILGWVPPRTHDWRRFRRPSELAATLRHEGLSLEAIVGLGYDPIRDRWRLTSDISVNYLLVAVHPPR